MKKIKKMFTTLVMVCGMLLLANIAFCQVNQTDEFVHFKSRSIAQGIIPEQIPDKYIKIEIHDVNIFACQATEIKKITGETLSVPNRYNRVNARSIKELRGVRKHPKPHYEFISEAGYFFGIGNVSSPNVTEDVFGLSSPYNSVPVKNTDAGYSIRTVHGIAFNDNFTLGLGIGADFYKKATFLPLTVDARLSIGKSAVRPYFNFGVGYSAPVDAKVGGLTLLGSIGLKAGNNWAFNLGIRTQTGAFEAIDSNGKKYQFNGTGKYLAISTCYYF